MLIVVLALAPLAIASIAQGIMHVRARQVAIDDLLRNTATYATHNEQNIFTGTAHLLNGLAGRQELHAGVQACGDLLQTALLGLPNVLNLTYVDSAGRPVCSATGRFDVADYSKLEWWKRVPGRKTAGIPPVLYSGASQQKVLPYLRPVRNAAGQFDGALIASLDLRWVSQTAPFGRLPPSALMLIVDRDGTVLAANRSVPQGFNQAVSRSYQDHLQHTFKSDGADGRWRWTAEQIPGSRRLIAFAMPEPMPFGVTRLYLLGNVLLPILMVILASVAMWLGTERFVIRWTTYLKRVSAAYAQNHFALELNELEDDAPEEFKILGREMKHMAGSIRDRDRTLSSALAQKSAMAREIHHRIKNNLQIVASLISLYSQNISDRASQLAFAQILARLGALTLIQRLMEMNDTTPIVDMRRMFTELADQMRTSAVESGVRYRLIVNSEEWLLPPDMATPVSFFAVEALTIELFAPQKEDMVRNVEIFFGGDGADHLLLWIEDGIFDTAAMNQGRPAPLRIFGALAEQLKAEYWVEKTPQGKSRLSLRLPVHSGTQGPAIRAPQAVLADAAMAPPAKSEDGQSIH